MRSTSFPWQREHATDVCRACANATGRVTVSFRTDTRKLTGIACGDAGPVAWHVEQAARCAGPWWHPRHPPGTMIFSPARPVDIEWHSRHATDLWRE